MKFSVIIPTYNRCSSLRQTIVSVLNVDYDDYEIIIVNDGSTDETGEYLNGLPRNDKIKVLSKENQGPAAARNAGLRVAHGQWIAFTDDDCSVPKNWLRRFEQEFLTTSPDIIGGSVKNSCERNLFSEVSQEMSSYYVEYLNAHGRHEFLTSNNIAYTAGSIRSAGGFNERFRRPGGEERVLNYDILARGGKSIFLRDQCIQHAHCMTAGDFIRQHRNYGRGSYVLHHLLKKGGGEPITVPSAAHGSLLMVWLTKEGIRGMKKCALFAIAQLAVISGYIRETFSPQTT